jgi:hypothetical protein
MAHVSNTTVILVLILVGLVLFVVARCTIGCGKKSSENFTRTPLSGDTTARFVRTPVDFAMRMPPQGAWQKNPHWMAYPGDEEQPLDFGPIDFYKDERNLADGRLYEEFGNNYVGGTQEPHIVNDTKTRLLLTEVGDLTTRRVLDNIPAAGWPRDSSRAPAQTDGTGVMDISNPLDDPKYGGHNYFWRDQVGN